MTLPSLQADATKASLADSEAGVQAAQDASQSPTERESNRNPPRSTLRPVRSRLRAQNARAKQAVAQVEAAQAQLDQAKLNLSYTKIVAPANGIITRKSLEAEPEHLCRPEPAYAGLARRSLGHRQLQGDPAQAHLRRPEGRS
jgi:multidrug efflux pump subunit AcrA (membrane-fusion protein)